jgi:enamine deaminase RidA (YjgF/YER057c/UK114 family)
MASTEKKSHIETVHHEGYDPNIVSPFVPAIKVHSGKLVFLAGVTAAPPYHDHPHRPEVFDALPRDIEGQVRLAFEHLDLALEASGCKRSHIVSLTRFFSNVREHQDAVNRFQMEWFGGHIPTSTTVEVGGFATDPRILLEVQATAVAPES